VTGTEHPSSTASVTTDRAARYGKQLASHLGRRLDTRWEAETNSGSVSFEHGRCELRATDEILQLRIDLDRSADPAAVDERLDRMEDVIGRHLVRFGARDELVTQWVRSDGSSGSMQRNEGEDGGGAPAPSER
jgi:hypothetical protein